ncbi:hypothetical protein RAS1_13880 [Phycisphaerae bacterium RAS1]|nr:hypothetical protein RAS1_13880 [Phycisphaerae bacterium RAS1]
MKLNLVKELAALEQMTVGQLQQRYADVFGEAVRSRHKQYLIRRIAWRLQANAEGGLSERALRRAEELADVADVRVTPPRGGVSANPGVAATRPDPRLPPVGAAITRKYKGRTLTVTVLADGFEHAGDRYPSLTAVAKAITGSHMNGFRFFQIEGKP